MLKGRQRHEDVWISKYAHQTRVWLKRLVLGGSAILGGGHQVALLTDKGLRTLVLVGDESKESKTCVWWRIIIPCV